MPSGILGLDLTFALTCASATFFLFLRCHGQGRPFGPRSRWWALAVIGVTGVVSTAATFIAVIVVNQLPSAFFGLGVVAPSGLWLSEIRSRGGDGRRSPLRDVSTLWLTRLLSRFATTRSEESRLDSLADPSNLSGLDESDPRSMARWMRKMGKEMGEEFGGEEFDEMVDEMETGKMPDEGGGDLDSADGGGDPSDD